VRESLDGLLRQTGLLAVAAGIALGWTAVRVAQAAGDLVVGLLDERPEREGFPPPYFGAAYSETLTLHIGDRALLLAPLVHSLIAFAVVLAAALFAFRASRRRI
jgi:hypothetical protein